MFDQEMKPNCVFKRSKVIGCTIPKICSTQLEGILILLPLGHGEGTDRTARLPLGHGEGTDGTARLYSLVQILNF